MRCRWIIRKGKPGHLTNPDRPWQLWLSTGELMGLKAERSSHAFCVQVMGRLDELYQQPVRRATVTDWTEVDT